MHGFLKFLLLISLTSLSIVAHAQHPRFILNFGTTDSIQTDAILTVRVLLDNPGGDLAGWSVVVCHDANIDVVDAQAGGAVSTANGGAPAQFAVTWSFPEEGVRQGVIVDFYGRNELPVSTNHELIKIEYIVLGADNTITEINFCDYAFRGDVFISNTIVIETAGVSIDPTINSVQISIYDPKFIRGDINNSSTVDIADVLMILRNLFFGEAVLCEDACDINNDSSINLADPIQLLSYLFNGGESPAPPFPDCGIDSIDDSLKCTGPEYCP